VAIRARAAFTAAKASRPFSGVIGALRFGANVIASPQ
jgi:hypothetical protein